MDKLPILIKGVSPLFAMIAATPDASTVILSPPHTVMVSDDAIKPFKFNLFLFILN
jgi:hypothetical protein